MERSTHANSFRCIAVLLILLMCITGLFSCASEDVELFDHNPYYDLDIPDSVFKTHVGEWREFGVGESTSDGFTPVKYYTYSFKEEKSENILTYIIILRLRIERDLSCRKYFENNEHYAEAGMDFEIILAETPRTVVYYPEKDCFSFASGGKKVRISEPAIEFKKASSGVPHVLVSRYSYGDATSKGGLFGLGELKLGDLEYFALDVDTYDFDASIDTTSVNAAADHTVAKNNETYYSNAMNQKYFIGAVIGGVRSTLRGYLEKQGQYFGVRVSFAVPYENVDAVFDIDCDFSVTPEIK